MQAAACCSACCRAARDLASACPRQRAAGSGAPALCVALLGALRIAVAALNAVFLANLRAEITPGGAPAGTLLLRLAACCVGILGGGGGGGRVAAVAVGKAVSPRTYEPSVSQSMPHEGLSLTRRSLREDRLPSEGAEALSVPHHIRPVALPRGTGELLVAVRAILAAGRAPPVHSAQGGLPPARQLPTSNWACARPASRQWVPREGSASPLLRVLHSHESF